MCVCVCVCVCVHVCVWYIYKYKVKYVNVHTCISILHIRVSQIYINVTEIATIHPKVTHRVVFLLAGLCASPALH